MIEVNERQRAAMIPKIEKLVGDLKGKTIAVLGLSFKPETDDMREAPSMDIIRGARRSAARRVRAYDPVAMSEAKKMSARHRIRGGRVRGGRRARTRWSS